jgi:hypothetical protein
MPLLNMDLNLRFRKPVKVNCDSVESQILREFLICTIPRRKNTVNLPMIKVHDIKKLNLLKTIAVNAFRMLLMT